MAIASNDVQTTIKSCPTFGRHMQVHVTYLLNLIAYASQAYQAGEQTTCKHMHASVLHVYVFVYVVSCDHTIFIHYKTCAC